MTSIVAHAFAQSQTGPGTGGIVGRPLSPDERLALVEFLKSDCINGPDPRDATASETGCDALAGPARPDSR